MHLVVDPNIILLVDIVVIDVPDSWGMLLCRKFTFVLGRFLQIDLYYATIGENFIALHREPLRKYHMEDPRNPMNDFACLVDGHVGNYAILCNRPG